MSGNRTIARAVRNVVEQLENRVLLSGATDVWMIKGDLSRRHPNDNVIIDIDPANTLLVRARINGTVVGTRALAGLSEIDIGTGEGNDRVSVEMGRAGAGILVGAWGGRGDDKLVGDAGRQVFYGGSGSDYIEGAGGDDALFGDEGNDDLSGGDGNDKAVGGAGDDTLAGGWGMDRLMGMEGSDQLIGGEGRDKIAAGDDKDTVKGGAGRDAIDGGAGRDWLYHEYNRDSLVSDSLDRLRGENGTLPMVRSGKEQLKAQIRQQSLDNWGYKLGTKLDYGWWRNGGVAAVFNAGTPTFASSGSTVPDTPTADHSNTNTQEENVDEADLVETDGAYLYSLVNNRLVITGTQSLNVVCNKTLAGSALGMYLIGDKLSIISWNWDGGAVTIDGSVTPPAGYIMPTVYHEYTRVSTYDISDPANPTLTEQTDFDGDYVDSRAIGDRVYVVVSNTFRTVYPRILSDGKGGLQYESKDQYLARLDSQLESVMPGFRGYNADGDTIGGQLVDDDNFWLPVDDNDNWWYTPTLSIAEINVGDGIVDPVAATTIGGYRGSLYVSGDSLYIAQSDWYSVGGETVNLFKFSLDNDSVTLAASAKVGGHIQNQFSMDEEGQHFRIATTRSWGTGANSAVTILDQVGEDLRQVGFVDGIGPGEQIYAVRFVGDRGYVITFVQTDPLFVLDLADPTAPKVTGELVIPGFSRYLHPIDEDHLIGLGRSADENGRTTGIQASLFDVSDPANPTRVDTFDVMNDTSWNWSMSEYDHHAFSYFPESGVLAFPVTGYSYTSYTDHYYMQVVQVDPTTGFTPLGTIDHTQYVLRGVRVGDRLFSIGNDAIRVVKLLNPDEIIGVVNY